jgi:hypothetical protein
MFLAARWWVPGRGDTAGEQIQGQKNEVQFDPPDGIFLTRWNVQEVREGVPLIRRGLQHK